MLAAPPGAATRRTQTASADGPLSPTDHSPAEPKVPGPAGVRRSPGRYNVDKVDTSPSRYAGTVSHGFGRSSLDR
jgi:hypothetical protein